MYRVKSDSPDREQAFIQACLAHHLFPERPVLPAPADLDWERLFELLARYRLAGDSFVLGTAYPGLWPQDIQERLRQERYKMLLYGEQCQKQVHEVLSALSAASIPVIVLKGWALIYTLYGGDPSRRFCDDIDLLVHPGDIDAAESILARLNYQGADETRPGYTRRFRNARCYVQQPNCSGGEFSVGLHWGLFHTPAYDPKQVEIRELFECAQPLKIAGADALELRPEHHLVYSCAHLGLHHVYDKALFRYFEIALFCRKTVLQEEKILEQARRWRCILPLKRVLEKVEALWPGAIPAGLLQMLRHERASLGEHFVENWILLTGGRPAGMALLNWLTLPGLRNRLDLFVQDIFPDRAYLQRHYGSPPGGIWPLLYARRLLGLKEKQSPAERPAEKPDILETNNRYSDNFPQRY